MTNKNIIMGIFDIFKKKEVTKSVVEEVSPYNEFQDVDDSIAIAIDSGYDNEKAVLLTLSVLIKEYEKLKRLGLELNAERTYKKIEYCRTKRVSTSNCI